MNLTFMKLTYVRFYVITNLIPILDVV